MEENILVNILKIYIISICTYYINLKLINKKANDKIEIIIILISIFFNVIVCNKIKVTLGFTINIVCVIIFLAILFSILVKNKLINSIFITTISLSINYIIFGISIVISFCINIIINIKSVYINMAIIILIYIFMLYYFTKIKRFKNGFIFLQRKLNSQNLEIVILNISVMVLYCIMVLSNYNELLNRKLWIWLIIFSIMMFVTIQKFLQLYYKQRLIMQDLEETTAELEEKKKEIVELEKEILNHSKKSHSIAHRQKSLEYKLSKLIYNSEIASEIGIKEEVEKIGKEISGEKVETELRKTEIEEIDDMLKYMQSECGKNQIEFELQINGNIHQMINNYIAKEKLEILIADHIKNAIIAINHSKNIYKNILVRIGKIDGYFSLYIYDTGIEFKKETLEKLGKEPSTTYKDDGGTGMGFMNTFDTLKECKASLIIKEIGAPSKNNYTKVIKIKFDNKNEFEIDSYRKVKNTKEN